MPANRFDIQFTREAEKDLVRLRPWTDEATQAILRLADDPYLGHTLSGNLKGLRPLEFTLKGSGAHRAVYVVFEAEQVCLIFIVGPHENIYRKAERRLASLRREGWS
jgi:mRNA-degrading endonuclease RelE of RelBE toxin-antitoxin system